MVESKIISETSRMKSLIKKWTEEVFEEELKKSLKKSKIKNNKTKKSDMKENKIVKIGSVLAKKHNVDTLEHCIKISEPALLIGETGTGKTSLVREMAKKKKKNLIRVSLTGSTGVEEILGKWLAKEGSTVWQDGILTAAMKNGDWIVFDEINSALPEILFALHSLLDDDKHVLLVEKNNDLIKPHKDFRFFGTMNPSEDYAGTKELNKALISRFYAILNIDVVPEIEEIKILTDVYKIPEAQAKKLVGIADFLRKEKEKEKIFYFCSTRDIIQAGKLFNSGLDFDVAITHSIVNKMNKDEVKEVKDFLEEYILEEEETRSIKSILDENKKLTKSVADAEKALFEEKQRFNDYAHKTANEIVKFIHKKTQDTADTTMMVEAEPEFRSEKK